MQCPRCKSVKLHKQGITSAGKQRFKCPNCKKNFTPGARPGNPYGNPHGSPRRVYAPFTCPQCGSDQLHKKGWTTKGRQIYGCYDCDKRFTPTKYRYARKELAEQTIQQIIQEEISKD